jgi:phosphatidylserine/phosphatidylglycerophosphate/cardiolipin synthase-like enzyme
LKPVAPALLAAGVKVYDYRLERSEGAGRETFHAKVVLADNTCYVGSFNMTQWSLGHSLELGLAATGASALRIADVLSAIADVSERVALS